jgi:hypothetical protein
MQSISFLADFNQNQDVSINFNSNHKHENPNSSSENRVVSRGQADRRMDR